MGHVSTSGNDRGHSPPADADVRAELARVLSSPVFAAQERLQQFLSYVVEQTLSGHGAELKERTIGVEALGRRIDYDPKIDPSVRVQARRLREKLAEYYESAPGTEIQIVLPKGSYVPEFVRTGTEEGPQVDAPAPPPPARLNGSLIYFALGSLATVAAAGLFAFRHTPEAVPASARIRLFTGGRGTYNHPAFSPDGTRVAFDWTGPADDNTDIYVQKIDADAPVRLTSNAAPDARPCWSPDGKRIGFLRRITDARIDVITIDAQGGAARTIGSLTAVGDPPRLDWSPDGSTLVTSTQTEADNPKRNLILMSVASGSVRALTSAPLDATADNEGTFSPDGATVAFIRAKAVGVQDIYLVSSRGGEPQRLTTDDTLVGGVAWQPDSKSVVVISTRDGTYALWRIPVPSGPAVRLTALDSGSAFPAIAPGGSRIAFAVRMQDENIWRMDLDTRQATQAIASPQTDSSPAVSPDGTMLAFRSSRTGGSEIWVSDIHGGSPRRLTHVEGAAATGPDWSPDGKTIVYTSTWKGLPHIWMTSRDGGAPKRVTSDAAGETSAYWSRDGRSVYYASAASGISEVWRKPLDGGPSVQITHGGAVCGQESFDGRMLYFTKGEQKAGLWRQPLEGGAEELAAPELPARLWGEWRAAKGGVYFLSFLWKQPYTEDLYFYDEATGKARIVASTPGVAAPFGAGMGASPSEHSVYFVQVDHWGVGLYFADRLAR